MSIALVRIDDRLIHGQVVVGWVQAIRAKRIVLVDDKVRTEEWEQELYRLGVPPELDLQFVSVDEAADRLEEWEQAKERAIILVGSVETMARLCDKTSAITRVNVGGVHDSEGRRQVLPYVYLSSEESDQLRALTERGVRVSAQDTPTARKIALGELL